MSLEPRNKSIVLILLFHQISLNTLFCHSSPHRTTVLRIMTWQYLFVILSQAPQRILELLAAAVWVDHHQLPLLLSYHPLAVLPPLLGSCWFSKSLVWPSQCAAYWSERQTFESFENSPTLWQWLCSPHNWRRVEWIDSWYAMLAGW